MEKVRKAFYVEEELLGQVDALLPQADVRSRNEFVNQALRFYIGYLTSEKIENYMLTTISSVMHATVKDSENRMARAMYKLAVETSKPVSYTHLDVYKRQGYRRSESDYCGEGTCTCIRKFLMKMRSL